jgi:hypothetical protein
MLALVILGALAPAVPTSATATADDGSARHHVTYTVTVDQPAAASIYYRDVDPPTWADYSHDPYRFSPRADVRLEPGTPWVHDTTLTNPDQWAMVTVIGVGSDSVGSDAVSSDAGQTVRCRLAVDGVEVDHAEGAHGALCSLRNW